MSVEALPSFYKWHRYILFYTLYVFLKSFYLIAFFPFLCQTEQLLEFMHQLPAFANMTMSVRRDLCSVMMFEVVEQAGTVILHNKQEVRLIHTYTETGSRGALSLLCRYFPQDLGSRCISITRARVKIKLWAHYFIPQEVPVRGGVGLSAFQLPFF